MCLEKRYKKLDESDTFIVIEIDMSYTTYDLLKDLEKLERKYSGKVCNLNSHSILLRKIW